MSDDHQRSWLRLVRYAATGLLLGGAAGFVGALVLPRPRQHHQLDYLAPVPRQGAADDLGIRHPSAGQDVVLVGEPATEGQSPARRDPLVERR